MPARPAVPEPRKRLMSTVSAWSSAVCPVNTSAGSTPYRAARARASRFVPCSTRTVRDSNSVPSSLAIAATKSASRDESWRSEWSTCHAVTGISVRQARRSNASESAPPDTAQCRCASRGKFALAASPDANTEVSNRSRRALIARVRYWASCCARRCAREGCFFASTVPR